MRSKLFIPGSRPDLFPKALASAADALSFDLEDAVAPSRKQEARSAVARFLDERQVDASNKTVIVRVNAIDSPYFEADVYAIARPGLHMVNLPKPNSPLDVQRASAALAAAERAIGWAGSPIGLLLNIETPQALRHAAELAAADARVVGLQLGLADLFESLGVARDDQGAVQQVMLEMRLAAGEAGVFAYDSAYPVIRSTEGFETEARQARRLGYLGKSCIHPSQIALANAVFQPTPAELQHALAVVDSSRQADAAGAGAYALDGQMVDAPFIQRAHAVIAAARQYGLPIPGGSPKPPPGTATTGNDTAAPGSQPHHVSNRVTPHQN